MNKQLIATAALLAGIACTGTTNAVPPPAIESMRISANGNILFSIAYYMAEHPGCAQSEWDYVVPASAPQELRDAVLDAAIYGEYLDDISGTGDCAANTEILKSITTMSFL
jgi:hypothetical protein